MPHPKLIKHAKLRGEWAELRFMQCATERGFRCNKPWGETAPYDVVTDHLGLFRRVQVKCTDCLRAGAYETRATYTTGKGRAVYTKRDIDFIAAHVVPLNIWYIIPVEVCTPQPMLRFYPHRKAKRMRLEKYREAWHLLDPPLPNPPITIHACIDEDYPEGYDPEIEPDRPDENTDPSRD